MERFKSPVVLVAVLAQLVLVIGFYSPELSEQVKLIGGVIIEILTLIGILNNPTDPENF